MNPTPNNTVPNNTVTPNTTTPNTTTTNTTVGKIIPFPYTIAYVLVVWVSIGMRCLYPSTLLASVLMSLGSVLEIMAAVTLVIVGAIGTGIQIGVIILIALVGLIYVSNVISLMFVFKVLHNDSKFMNTYRKTVCANRVICILSVLFYHKFH